MIGFDERDSTSLTVEQGNVREDYTRDAEPAADRAAHRRAERVFRRRPGGRRRTAPCAPRSNEFVKLGATLVDISLPKTALSIPTYYIIAPAEASSNLSRFDGVRYGHRASEYKDLQDMYRKTRAEGFGAEVKRRILVGTYVLCHGYYDAYYVQAQKIRRLIADDFQAAFADKCDVIMGPVAPTVAWDLGAKSNDPVANYLADIFTLSTSLAGLPGMSIPCGFGAGREERQAAGRPANHRQLLRRSEAAEHRAPVPARDRLAYAHAGRRLIRADTEQRENTMQWEVVIGLENHVQLTTQSKIFSGSAIHFGAEPNTQASPVDLALPGVLPVLNRGAVERAIRFGLAVGGTIAPQSVFARKNYFYPDLPKGYQISQFADPVVQGGTLTFAYEKDGKLEMKTVNLTRAHLEEDAGKSLHEDYAGMSGIDLNRAGTPLLEIVSEPEMRSAAEAVAYAKAMHSLVMWLGVCDGNMQEGSFRCDVNVSVRPVGQQEFGTRCEIKNLNSFRFMEEAIHYEVRRQIELIEDGGKVIQATRLWDPDRKETRSMRTQRRRAGLPLLPRP